MMSEPVLAQNAYPQPDELPMGAYVDARSKTVIKPKFDKAFSFSGSLPWVVKEDSRRAYVNQKACLFGKRTLADNQGSHYD
jgi:hypothetical protein